MTTEKRLREALETCLEAGGFTRAPTWVDSIVSREYPGLYNRWIVTAQNSDAERALDCEIVRALAHAADAAQMLTPRFGGSRVSATMVAEARGVARTREPAAARAFATRWLSPNDCVAPEARVAQIAAMAPESRLGPAETDALSRHAVYDLVEAVLYRLDRLPSYDEHDLETLQRAVKVYAQLSPVAAQLREEKMAAVRDAERALRDARQAAGLL